MKIIAGVMNKKNLARSETSIATTVKKKKKTTTERYFSQLNSFRER